MKKLMIALTIVVAAACSQAANWRWNTVTSASLGPLYGADGKTLLNNVTAYVFADGQQSAVYENWYNNGKFDGGMKTGSLDDKTVSSGEMTAATTYEFQTTSTSGTKQNFFFAIIDADNNLFISGTKGSTTMAETQSGTLLSFAEQGNSKKLYKDTTSYGSAGWYAAAVPEPTSGLLLLLGVAGLALRRRRA